MTSIRDAVVLVTGANGGLGTEFVSQCLERGASKVYAAARTPRQWDDVRIVSLQLDVTDPAQIEAAVELAGDVTVLVNNAGIAGGSSLVDGPAQEVRDQMETNFFAPVALTRAFAPALLAAGGAVVNVASVVSWIHIANAYSASKAALWAATNAMRVDLGARGVHVLGAYLGYTNTPMLGSFRDDANDPADVVRAVLDGLETGADEVLADETTRQVRAGLGLPVADLLAAVGS